MRKFYTLTFALTILGSSLFGQCVENEKNSILLAGDSWAFFQLVDGTLNEGLRTIGHSDKRYVTNAVISENGAETDDFQGQEKQDAIQELVDQNPDVKIIHMSIGGNDVLGDWNVNFTQQQTDSLENNVAERLYSVVEFLKTTREGIDVFWPGYCYPNFGEVITDLPPEFVDIYPFTDLWNDMGQPNFLQINSILNEFSDSVGAYFDTDPALHFVPAQGVLQYHFGQEEAMSVAPMGTYERFEAPLPLGYPEYPSPKESMRLYLETGFLDIPDSFHLSAEGYRVMFKYQAEKYHQKALMDEMYKRSSGGSSDGTVSSSGTLESEIQVGEQNGDDLAAILTFDISDFPDTTLQGASIFMRRESLIGDDPFSGDVQVDMKNGFFGTSVDLEADDFQEAGTSSGFVCVFGSRESDGHWLRLDLTAEMLMNLGGQDEIQFRISAPGFVGGTMAFHDSSDPDKAPILNLNYGPEPSAVSEAQTADNVRTYPNPSSGELTIGIPSNEIEQIEVMNLLGAVVFQSYTSSNKIDISELNTGTYILRVGTNTGTSTTRIIKR